MANNNFFLNNDPLLYQTPFTRHTNDSEELLKRQLNDSLMQYKMLQQQVNNPQQTHDYVNELDLLLKKTDDTILETLKNNEEYKQLNNELSSLIQSEIVSSIKWKLNGNSKVIKNIERQTELINEVNKSVDEERRKSLSEINDYVKNYSNITFDEYKKIKNRDYESKRIKVKNPNNG